MLGRGLQQDIIVTLEQDRLQALIHDITALLDEGSPKLPWVMAGASGQQRQLLDQARRYLLDLQDQAGSAVAPASNPPTDQDASQVVQALLQEMQYLRSQTTQLLNPLQQELTTLRQERELLLGQVRQLEQQRASQGAALEPGSDRWEALMQAFVDQLAAQMAHQVEQSAQRLEATAANAYLLGTAPEATAPPTDINPAQRLEHLKQIQRQSDQLVMGLDAALNSVFESLQQSIRSYQVSLGQGISQMHTLGKQGEMMFDALIDHLAQQMGQASLVGREASPAQLPEVAPPLPTGLPGLNGDDVLDELATPADDSPNPVELALADLDLDALPDGTELGPLPDLDPAIDQFPLDGDLEDGKAVVPELDDDTLLQVLEQLDPAQPLPTASVSVGEGTGDTVPGTAVPAATEDDQTPNGADDLLYAETLYEEDIDELHQAMFGDTLGGGAASGPRPAAPAADSLTVLAGETDPSVSVPAPPTEALDLGDLLAADDASISPNGPPDETPEQAGLAQDASLDDLFGQGITAELTPPVTAANDLPDTIGSLDELLPQSGPSQTAGPEARDFVPDTSLDDLFGHQGEFIPAPPEENLLTADEGSQANRYGLAVDADVVEQLDWDLTKLETGDSAPEPSTAAAAGPTDRQAMPSSAAEADREATTADAVTESGSDSMPETDSVTDMFAAFDEPAAPASAPATDALDLFAETDPDPNAVTESVPDSMPEPDSVTDVFAAFDEPTPPLSVSATDADSASVTNAFAAFGEPEAPPSGSAAASPDATMDPEIAPVPDSVTDAFATFGEPEPSPPAASPPAGPSGGSLDFILEDLDLSLDDDPPAVGESGLTLADLDASEAAVPPVAPTAGEVSAEDLFGAASPPQPPADSPVSLDDLDLTLGNDAPSAPPPPEDSVTAETLFASGPNYFSSNDFPSDAAASGLPSPAAEVTAEDLFGDVSPAPRAPAPPSPADSPISLDDLDLTLGNDAPSAPSPPEDSVTAETLFASGPNYFSSNDFPSSDAAASEVPSPAAEVTAEDLFEDVSPAPRAPVPSAPADSPISLDDLDLTLGNDAPSAPPSPEDSVTAETLFASGPNYFSSNDFPSDAAASEVPSPAAEVTAEDLFGDVSPAPSTPPPIDSTGSLDGMDQAFGDLPSPPVSPAPVMTGEDLLGPGLDGPGLDGPRGDGPEPTANLTDVTVEDLFGDGPEPPLAQAGPAAPSADSPISLDELDLSLDNVSSAPAPPPPASPISLDELDLTLGDALPPESPPIEPPMAPPADSALPVADALADVDLDLVLDRPAPTTEPPDSPISLDELDLSLGDVPAAADLSFQSDLSPHIEPSLPPQVEAGNLFADADATRPVPEPGGPGDLGVDLLGDALPTGEPLPISQVDPALSWDGLDLSAPEDSPLFAEAEGGTAAEARPAEAEVDPLPPPISQDWLAELSLDDILGNPAEPPSPSAPPEPPKSPDRPDDIEPGSTGLNQAESTLNNPTAELGLAAAGATPDQEPLLDLVDLADLGNQDNADAEDFDPNDDPFVLTDGDDDWDTDLETGLATDLDLQAEANAQATELDWVTRAIEADEASQIGRVGPEPALDAAAVAETPLDEIALGDLPPDDLPPDDVPLDVTSPLDAALGSTAPTVAPEPAPAPASGEFLAELDELGALIEEDAPAPPSENVAVAPAEALVEAPAGDDAVGDDVIDDLLTLNVAPSPTPAEPDPAFPPPPLSPPPIPEDDPNLWFLSLDVGATGLSAVLLEAHSGQVHPLYWVDRAMASVTADKFFRLPTIAAVDHQAGQWQVQSVGSSALTVSWDEGETAPPVLLRGLKTYLRLGIPHSDPDTGASAPQVCWADGVEMPLGVMQAALTQLMATLPLACQGDGPFQLGGIGLDEDILAQALGRLRGVVVGYPANWPDTYSFNLREAVLDAGLVASPDQVYCLEDSIAAVLSGLPDPHQIPATGEAQPLRQQTLYACDWVGGTVVISAGASVTELAIVDVPADLARLNYDDFLLYTLPYGGDGIDLDILCHLLHPADQRQPRPATAFNQDAAPATGWGWQASLPELDTAQWDQLGLADYSLPRPAEPDPALRQTLMQHLESSLLGQSVLEATRHLKLILQHQPQFDLDLADQRWTVRSKDLEDRIILPYIQRINGYLNRMLSESGLSTQGINQVICTGGSASIPKMARWLRQKFPNATIVQDTYQSDRPPSCSRVAYGLVNLVRYPQVLDLNRHQYSDPFLLMELLRTFPDQPMPLSGIFHLLEQRGVNTQACRLHLIALLEGRLPPGILPAADSPLLVPSASSTVRALGEAPLFHRQGSQIYVPNTDQCCRLLAHMGDMLATKHQTLGDPLIAQLMALEVEV